MHGPLESLNDPQWEIDSLREVVNQQKIDLKFWRERAYSAECKVDWIDKLITAEKHYAGVLKDKDETIRFLREKLINQERARED